MSFQGRPVIDVELTPVERLMACAVGALRQAESLKSQRRDAHGLEDGRDGEDLHILGAAGELAVARTLGRYWGGDVNSFKRPDIGASVQVRTRSKSDYDLIIRDDDDPKAVFVLVTGRLSRLVIHGWIKGEGARRDEWRKTYGNRPAAWFVPQDALMPLKVGRGV
jgi:hypothetical protein